VEHEREAWVTENIRLPDTERAVLEMAERTIAGGVVSINRKVAPRHVFVRAHGSRLWDANGREFIDYHSAFAPFILGHNFPAVNAAVEQAIREDWSLIGSGPTPWEAQLAQLICDAVPSVELLQIANSGSEAVALTLRLAQAYTGREEIVLMLGGYNGWQNEVARVVMPKAEVIGPRLSPGEYRFLPASAGIPADVRKRVHVVNFNDLASVELLLKTGRIACVLTEPVLQNIGVVLPLEGYLRGLIDLCNRHGALCIFDEIKTGFRCGLGGYQGIAGVRPHLSVFGKAIANGYPLSVIGGRAEILRLFDDPSAEKRVLIAGTYNAHPMVCAAAIATLTVLREPDTYPTIRKHSLMLYSGLREIFAEAGIAHALVHNESAFCVYFCERAPTDLHDILENHDFALDMRYRLGLIERGVYQIPLACKQGSVSFAHTAEDVARTLDVTRAVVKSL
jgi:glutamate-1-semialdehyde 2,1-aminomutase